MGVTRKITVGFIAGVMAFAVLIGGGGAWAYWTATVRGAATVTTPSVAVSQANFSVLNASFANAHSRLTSTGSFTVTNTGGSAGVATVSISATGGVAPQMPLRMWPVATAGACSAAAVIPGGAASGTWASATISNTTLAAGQSQIFCVRTTVPVSQRNALATTTGGTTILVNGTLNVSLAAAGWTATASGSAVQRSVGIYPLDNSLAPVEDSRWHAFRNGASTSVCMDVQSSSAVAGTQVIAYPCQADDGIPKENQFWQVIPVDETDRSLITLRPRHAPTMRLDVNGNQITIQESSAATSQQWYVQRVSPSTVQGVPPSTVQLVSAVDGRCLSIPASGILSMANCESGGTVLISPQRVPLQVSTLLTTATLAVGPGASTLRLQRWNGTAWTNLTTSSTATTLSFSAPLLSAGENTMRVVFPDGTVAYNLVLRYTVLGLIVTVVSGTG